VAVDQAAGTAYVANASSSTVSVIDLATSTVTQTIPVGGFPQGVALDPATRTVYVTNRVTRNVSVIDEASGTVTRTIPVGTSTYGLALDPARHAAYVTSGGRELLGDLYVVQPCR
jgi:serine/threonine-protein kinase